MPIDPALPIPPGPPPRPDGTTPMAGSFAAWAAPLIARLNELERHVRRLENQPAVQSGSGPPAADPTTLRTGSPYIDETNNNLYYVVASAWRHVHLT